MLAVPRRRSLKRNFGWALAGNLIYQGSQWLNLVILAKLLSVADVGRFALALAICSPITSFSALNLRAVQVTDARNEHRFGNFLAVQLLSSVTAMLVLIGIAVFGGYESETAWLIVVVGMGQAVILTRDVFIALNQKLERMDKVAMSKTLLAASSLTALSSVVWLTHDLLWGVVAMQVAKCAVFLLWDLRSSWGLVRVELNEQPSQYLRPIWTVRTMLSLIWLALPLGVTALLLNLMNNIPRYFIAAYLGDEALGYFAAIMSLVMAGMMVIQAAALAVLPRLSRYFVEDGHAFLRLFGKLILLSAALGVLGLLTVLTAGEEILRLVFSPEYADYTELFVWSMTFGAIAYVVTFLGFGLTAMRVFRIQPIANFVALVVTGMIAWLMIPAWGVLAGVWCLMAGRCTQAIISAIVIGQRLSTTARPSHTL